MKCWENLIRGNESFCSSDVVRLCSFVFHQREKQQQLQHRPRCSHLFLDSLRVSVSPSEARNETLTMHFLRFLFLFACGAKCLTAAADLILCLSVLLWRWGDTSVDYSAAHDGNLLNVCFVSYERDGTGSVFFVVSFLVVMIWWGEEWQEEEEDDDDDVSFG